jgi:hypothetical protein
LKRLPGGAVFVKVIVISFDPGVRALILILASEEVYIPVMTELPVTPTISDVIALLPSGIGRVPTIGAEEAGG